MSLYNIMNGNENAWPALGQQTTQLTDGGSVACPLSSISRSAIDFLSLLMSLGIWCHLITKQSVYLFLLLSIEMWYSSEFLADQGDDQYFSVYIVEM